MSSQICIENIENALGEEPSYLSHQNLDPAQTQNNMSNQDPSDDKHVGAEGKQIAQPQEEVIGAGCEMMEEDTLVEKVNKLDLTPPKTGKTPEFTNNNTGTVVLKKLSAPLSYLQDYNSDDNSSQSEDDNDVAMQGLQFHDLEDDSEDSEADSETEDYDSMDEFYGDGPPSEPKTDTAKKEDQRDEPDAAWMSLMSEFGITAESAQQVPDISMLELNNREEFKHIGNIDCILDKFVTIEGLPSMPAYDLATLLFVEEGQKVLGYVFDVMGPVSSPIYIVQLDSLDRIKNLQLAKGTQIYCAPKSKYTKYIFVHELMKIRGSDASWVGDTEVPPEFEEFSDDEQERQKKAASKSNKRKQGSLERHQQFEANMNKINQLNSRLHNMVDARNPLRQQISDSKPKNEQQNSSAHSAPSGVTPHWFNQPPPVPEQQHWRPLPVNAAVPPPQQFYAREHFLSPLPVSRPPVAATHTPEFDPSMPPPGYGGSIPCYYPPVRDDPVFRNVPPVASYASYVSHSNNQMATYRRRNGPNFRQNNCAGPSNGN